ncbi:MAG: hypothetical protein ACM36C_04615, partial [Acidobacteriota bacterium]
MTLRNAAGPLIGCILVSVLGVSGADAQTFPGSNMTAAAAQPEVSRDALGRSTPRGTVAGFVAAARKGDNGLARHYLDTPLDERSAAELARQLFVVLDASLPPRIRQLSDAPEGSRANPLTPDQELVGTISSATGTVEIVVERVTPPKKPPIWLFSRKTLASVPALYAEAVEHESRFVPGFLAQHRVGGIRLIEWLAILF